MTREAAGMEEEVGHRDKTGLRVEEMAVADRVKGDYPVQRLPAQIEPLHILIIQKLLACTGEPVLAQLQDIAPM